MRNLDYCFMEKESSMCLAGGISFAAPRLVADIGGTHARFALETVPGCFASVIVLPCAKFDSLHDAIRCYLADPGVVRLGGDRIRHAAIAIANPVDGDEIQMTNHTWSFSTRALQSALGFDTLIVVNDFRALAMAVPHLAPSEVVKVGGGECKPDGVIGVLGAGTGLGVSGLLRLGNRFHALDTEGGHVSFSPANPLEADILAHAWKTFPHVSAERLLSGIGLEIVYRALCERMGLEPEQLSVPQIIQRGLARSCPACDATIDAFCEMLGTVASNLAVTLGAKGGIYIGGGIVPRLGERFYQSGFRKRFEDKGRFVAYLARIPTYVITAEYPAFTGVSVLLAEAVGMQA
jgi:glucokinase